MRLVKATATPREQLWWLSAFAEEQQPGEGVYAAQPWAAGGGWMLDPGASCPGQVRLLLPQDKWGPASPAMCWSGLLVFLKILMSLLICNWMELIKCLGKVWWNFLMRSCVYWPCHSQQRELLMTGFTFRIYLHICFWRLVSNLWKNLSLTVLDPKLSF